MSAYIVRPAINSPYGNNKGSVMVNAPDEVTAKERGASMLKLPVSQVEAVPYGGPTLGQ